MSGGEAGERIGGGRCGHGRGTPQPWRPTFLLAVTPVGSASRRELMPCGDHWFGSLVDGLDDFGVVDPTEISRGDREVGVSELALDHDQRDPFACHLDGVRVPQLVRREPATHPGRECEVMELGADTGWCERPAAGRSAQNTEQPADRQVAAELQPWLQM